MACDVRFLAVISAVRSQVGDPHHTISSSDYLLLGSCCVCHLLFIVYILSIYLLARWILGLGSGSVGTEVCSCALLPLIARIMPELKVPRTGS